MCKHDCDYEAEPFSLTSVTITNPVRDLYERLIGKGVRIYDLFTDKDSAFVIGVLSEVIISPSNETVYLRLECLDHNVIKDIIICVGEGTGVVEI